MQAQEKTAALLIAHYGSSDAKTRAKTLDIITREAQECFPQLEVREAYISPIVRKHMERQGITKDSPLEALLKLRAEGYDTVYIQSTTLIEGSEMASVRNDANRMRSFFRKIIVGTPLLYSIEDCQQVVTIISALQPGKKEDIVYVGHGNQLPSTATYALLDFMLKARGLERFHISTIEGYPDLEATIKILKGNNPQKVTLIPLLLVCGSHAKEDIAGVWKAELTQKGYDVDVQMQGLGEIEAIRKIYLEHVHDMMRE